jgi:hypothetical protein
MPASDNPAYAALSGAHSRFAQRSGRALRYAADVAPFLALPSEATRTDWHDAIELVPSGTVAATIHDGSPLPESLKVMHTFELVQMIGEDARRAHDPEAVTLGWADVAEMLELVGMTDPGPFLKRTIELGKYVGIRRDGALVAMAGERLRFDGWTRSLLDARGGRKATAANVAGSTGTRESEQPQVTVIGLSECPFGTRA